MRSIRNYQAYNAQIERTLRQLLWAETDPEKKAIRQKALNDFLAQQSRKS